MHVDFSSGVRSSLLRHTQLGLEGLWHGWGRGTGQTKLDLHPVIDEPLESSEGSDHDYTGTQTSPHTFESESLGGVSDAGSLGLVHVAHDGVSGVRDHGTEHTGDVSGGECDHELLRLGALGSGFGDQVRVDGLHGALSRRTSSLCRGSVFPTEAPATCRIR